MAGGTAWNSTLPRRKAPLRAKTPNTLKRTPLRARSVARTKEEALYYRIKGKWIARPENRFCAVCICIMARIPWSQAKRALIYSGAQYIEGIGGVIQRAREIHHYRGRRGRLLCDERFFIATCRGCRDFPHKNPEAARALELLASATDWEVFPGPEIAGFPGG